MEIKTKFKKGDKVFSLNQENRACSFIVDAIKIDVDDMVDITYFDKDVNSYDEKYCFGSMAELREYIFKD